jgi:hypothetical protein
MPDSTEPQPEPAPPSDTPPETPTDLDTSPFEVPTVDQINAGLPGDVDLEL